MPASDKDFLIRKLTGSEIPSALELARKVFSEYESPDYPPEGTQEFYKCLDDEKYLSGMEYYGAFDGEKLVGMIGIRSAENHICLFFVDGGYHRRGIGTKMFRHLLKDHPEKTVTLNSSPYGVPFYKAIGFASTDDEKTVNGIRFTPMKYTKEVQKMKNSICGANCEECSFSQNCPGCEATCGKPFGGTCVAAEYIKTGGTEMYAQFKQNLLNEINDLLKSNDLPQADGLYELQGSFINLAYPVPSGKEVKFLDDKKIYLGAQIELDPSGLCCGVAADTTFILICRYGLNGSEPELIAYRKR